VVDFLKAEHTPLAPADEHLSTNLLRDMTVRSYGHLSWSPLGNLLRSERFDSIYFAFTYLLTASVPDGRPLSCTLSDLFERSRDTRYMQ